MEGFSGALGTFLATYGLLAVFIVMLLKEAGIPVPVPSDLIMITAGVQAATGVFRLFDLTVAIVIAIFLGGSAQFLLSRSVGRQVIYRLGRYVGLTPERLDGTLARLQRRGAMAVFLGLNVPGARAGIIPAAGLARLAYLIFVPAMLGGSGLFYTWHIALGYIIGPSAETLFENLQLPIVPVLLVGLGGLGLVGWVILRRRRTTEDDPESALVDRMHSWTHAACPACLAITVIQRNMREGDYG